MSLYQCCPLKDHQHHSGSSPLQQSVKRNKSGHLSIDMHCHVLVPEVEELIADLPSKQGEGKFLSEMWGEESYKLTMDMIKEVTPNLIDVNVRLNDMDSMGIDIQAISPTPGQYYYWADKELSQELVRLQNERIAEICAQHPTRFVGLGAISLQHPELACEQMEYAIKKLGFKGVEISTLIGDKNLNAPVFEQVWRKAEELKAVVFIHPLGTSLGARVQSFYLSNVIGQPLETTIALSHLILGGVLDRYPDLKLLAAHGGGYLPQYLGRTEHAYAARSDVAAVQKPPSEYLKTIYFDSLVYLPEELANLVRQVGVSQVVIGTDYPFDMGHYDPNGLIDSLENLSDGDKNALRGGNAERLLGL